MSADRIPPLACPDLWQAVMAAAAGRCQCRGTCGKNHAKDGGRCPREHDHLAHRHGGGTVHLIAAPAEPADMLLPPHRAAALPKRQLAAWCSPCHDATRAAARKAQHTAVPAAEPDALFEI
ncbi:hypothetical protein P3T37_002254 [Kitasatospora sp. MAA4]|uniref:hypothetical protein n=1 Tax=Kitasatospora sp. MAA4 TaxID=3035093 RepID=UPI0024766EFC|nr:hypothetical protein [Kitasatospora sp. MAA4]MDH6132868.1 hypothetical protein [Kitasatospora sp. MAA4]